MVDYKIYLMEDQLKKFNGFFIPRLDTEEFLWHLRSLVKRKDSSGVLKFWTSALKTRCTMSKVLEDADNFYCDEIISIVESFVTFMDTKDYAEFKAQVGYASVTELLLAINRGKLSNAQVLLSTWNLPKKLSAESFNWIERKVGSPISADKKHQWLRNTTINRYNEVHFNRFIEFFSSMPDDLRRYAVST